MDSVSQQSQQLPTPQPMPAPTYPTPTPLMQALDWMLSNPSIPLSFRKQFYVLWENVIFGNYDDMDRKFLMSKFREWCIQTLWYIPEQKWGNGFSFSDIGDTVQLNTDLNLLLNTLEQLYYIQLTRGKDGFTVIELTTTRNKLSSADDTAIPKKKKGISLF